MAERSVSHLWSEETMEAKARWWQSLSPQERVDLFYEMMEMILANRPDLVETSREGHVITSPDRIRVLELP